MRDLFRHVNVSLAEELACLAPASGDGRLADAERLRAKLEQIIRDVDRTHLVPSLDSSVRKSVVVDW